MVTLRTLFERPVDARWTAQEYVDSPYSAQKSDLIEGVMILATPASYEHEVLQSFIMLSMGLFVETRGLGRVFGSNLAYRLSDVNVFQPDVSFIRGARLSLAQVVFFPSAPDIAVEIVSPSSRHYDEVEKITNYARFGVREYWLVDPLTHGATFYRLAGDQFLPITQDDTRLRSEILLGFWLDLEWLFPPAGRERPTAVEAVRAMGVL